MWHRVGTINTELPHREQYQIEVWESRIPSTNLDSEVAESLTGLRELRWRNHKVSRRGEFEYEIIGLGVTVRELGK